MQTSKDTDTAACSRSGRQKHCVRISSNTARRRPSNTWRGNQIDEERSSVVVTKSTFDGMLLNDSSICSNRKAALKSSNAACTSLTILPMAESTCTDCYQRIIHMNINFNTVFGFGRFLTADGHSNHASYIRHSSKQLKTNNPKPVYFAGCK